MQLSADVRDLNHSGAVEICSLRRTRDDVTLVVMGRSVVALLLLGALTTSTLPACASSTHAVVHHDTRRLRALERQFHAFVATPLRQESDVEAAIAELESLRLEYVDALTAASTERERVQALVRLAELHLDLSARIRRVPYPNTTSRAAFDARLSSWALPLEATGISVLQQVAERADNASGADDRFVKRARLYLHLHTSTHLTDDDDDVLRDELVASDFRAPRSLLDTGRIGQRAARR